MIPAFKKERFQRMNRSKEYFNSKLGSARVKTEHCIGMLKSRFPILRSIPIFIKGWRDCKFVVDVFAACAILHNILINDVVPQEWYDEIEEFMKEDELYDDVAVNNRRPDNIDHIAIDPNSRRDQVYYEVLVAFEHV